MIKKIRNIIKYRIALISNWYLRKIKYRKVKNKNLKDQIVRYDIYKQVKRKYSKAIIKNSNPSPKNNSNKIWICWFQGLDNAPLLIKKCISSIKKNLKDNEVIILTMDNYKDYVDFPDYILEKVEKKEISLTHFSDLLRLNVLIKYGGIWIDATVLCTTNKLPSYIYREPLFVFKEINLNPLDTLPVTASSWFIASGPNNNILLATRELLYTYWQKNNYLQDYFLFHICFKIATEIYKDEWDNVPTYNNINPHMLQFELQREFDIKRWEELINMSPFHKLTRHVNTNGNLFTNLDYILNDYKKNK